MIITRKIVRQGEDTNQNVYVVFTQQEHGIVDIVYEEKIAKLTELYKNISKTDLYLILAACQKTCLEKLKSGYVLFAREAQFKHQVTSVETDILGDRSEITKDIH